MCNYIGAFSLQFHFGNWVENLTFLSSTLPKLIGIGAKEDDDNRGSGR